MASYSNLMDYRHCPRLHGFKLLGYESPTVSEALNTGIFVHKAIAAHFRNTNWLKAITDASNEALANLSKIQDIERKAKALKDLELAGRRAEALANRYINSWASDYKAPLMETVLKLGNVVCHPDMIATYSSDKFAQDSGKRVIVDFKTSRSPDIRTYKFSGQADLYAYVDNQICEGSQPNNKIDLVIYDIISEEGIYRDIAPPLLSKGEYLFNQVQLIPQDKDKLLAEPHCDWQCSTRCDFFQPCWLLETGTVDDCFDFLDKNYIRKGNSELSRA